MDTKKKQANVPNAVRSVPMCCLGREIGACRKDIGPSKYLQWAAEEKLIHKNHEEFECVFPEAARSTFLMVFSADGKMIASTHGNHNVYVTDLTNGKHIKTLSGHPRTPWCIAFHPSSNQILASGCLGGQVRVWDLHGGSEIWMVESQTVIASLTFHPTDRVLVIASYNEVHFWDWSQEKPFAKCSTAHEREKVRYVSFDRYGHKLITGIANAPRIQSQWDRVAAPQPPPHAPQSEHERRITICYRYMVEQYEQLVERYIRLSNMEPQSENNSNRSTPPQQPRQTMDRGTDPMDPSEMRHGARCAVCRENLVQPSTSTAPPSTCPSLSSPSGSSTPPRNNQTSEERLRHSAGTDEISASHSSSQFIYPSSASRWYPPMASRWSPPRQPSDRPRWSPPRTPTSRATRWSPPRPPPDSTDSSRSNAQNETSRTSFLLERIRAQVETGRQLLARTRSAAAAISARFSPLGPEDGNYIIERIVNNRTRLLEEISIPPSPVSPSPFTRQPLPSTSRGTFLSDPARRIMPSGEHEAFLRRIATYVKRGAIYRVSRPDQPLYPSSMYPSSARTTPKSSQQSGCLICPRGYQHNHNSSSQTTRERSGLSPSTSTQNIDQPSCSSSNTRQESSDSPRRFSTTNEWVNNIEARLEQIHNARLLRMRLESGEAIARLRAQFRRLQSAYGRDREPNVVRMAMESTEIRLMSWLTEFFERPLNESTSNSGSDNSSNNNSSQSSAFLPTNISSFNELPELACIRYGVQLINRYIENLTNENRLQSYSTQLQRVRALWIGLHAQILNLQRAIRENSSESDRNNNDGLAQSGTENVDAASNTTPHNTSNSSTSTETNTPSSGIKNLFSDVLPTTSTAPQVVRVSPSGPQPFDGPSTSGCTPCPLNVSKNVLKRLNPCSFRRSLPKRPKYDLPHRLSRFRGRGFHFRSVHHDQIPLGTRGEESNDDDDDDDDDQEDDQDSPSPLRRPFSDPFMGQRRKSRFHCSSSFSRFNQVDAPRFTRFPRFRTVPGSRPARWAIDHRRRRIRSFQLLDELNQLRLGRESNDENELSGRSTPTGRPSSQSPPFDRIFRISARSMNHPNYPLHGPSHGRERPLNRVRDSMRSRARIVLMLMVDSLKQFFENDDLTRPDGENLSGRIASLTSLLGLALNLTDVLLLQLGRPSSVHVLRRGRTSSVHNEPVPSSRPSDGNWRDITHQQRHSPSRENRENSPLGVGSSNSRLRAHSTGVPTPDPNVRVFYCSQGPHLQGGGGGDGAGQSDRRETSDTLGEGEDEPVLRQPRFSAMTGYSWSVGGSFENIDSNEMENSESQNHENERESNRQNTNDSDYNQTDEQGSTGSNTGNRIPPLLRVNDLPVPPDEPWVPPAPPRNPPINPLFFPTVLRPRYLSPRYFNPLFVGDPIDEPSSTQDRNDFYVFRGPHHRIQAWDFSKFSLPELHNPEKNLVVNECKIHNDASVDISSDGNILVTLLSSGRLNMTTMLGVYSLDWDTLGQCLYTTSFDQNAVSVSLSPTTRHLIVGLATRRISFFQTEKLTIAQIFKLEGGKPGKKFESLSKGRLVLVRDLEMSREPTDFVSLNCIRWAPTPGEGFVYATNAGKLKILR